MSESLQVELNDGSVHAIDAPRAFTAEGPFHVVLDNAGGAVHVHLHLDDDLSRVSRVDEVNHYVEEGATKRIPIGVVPDRPPITGRLKVVSGYGAEVSYVDLTIVPNATASGGVSSGSGAGGRDGSPGRRGTAERPDTSRGRADGSSTDRSVEGHPSGSDAATTPEIVRRKNTSPRGNQRSSTALGPLSNAQSNWEVVTRVLSIGGLSAATARARRGSPEALVFLALAVVALFVGVGVVLLVREALLALVVLAIVAATVAVAGWLLLASDTART